MRLIRVNDKVMKVNPNLRALVQLEENFGSPLNKLLFREDFTDEMQHQLNSILTTNYEPIEDEKIQGAVDTIILGELFLSMGVFNDEIGESEESTEGSTWISEIVEELFLGAISVVDITKEEFMDLTFEGVYQLQRKIRFKQREDFHLQQLAFTNVMGAMYVKNYKQQDPFEDMDKQESNETGIEGFESLLSDFNMERK